ncbi:hypothetical protein BC830DRAFT_1174358 [Chytriomyces sp. MP71]|nr:hypothetical protein BC830DRAFT_1174358 [Chytriomyces sp. MP71]
MAALCAAQSSPTLTTSSNASTVFTGTATEAVISPPPLPSTTSDFVATDSSIGKQSQGHAIVSLDHARNDPDNGIYQQTAPCGQHEQLVESPYRFSASDFLVGIAGGIDTFHSERAFSVTLNLLDTNYRTVQGSVDTVRSNQQGFTLNIKSLDGGYSGSYILQAVVISDFDTSTPLYRCIDAFFSPAVGQQRVNPFTFTKSTSRVENSLTSDETTTAPSGGLDPAPISRPTPVATSAPQTLSTGILPASTSTPEPVTSPSTLTVSAIEPPVKQG